jgi:hypothetical protein
LGVDGGSGGRRIEGEGGLWQGGLGLLPPLRCQVDRTRGKRVFQDPWTPERDLQQILFSPFGRLEREGKERGRRD